MNELIIFDLETTSPVLAGRDNRQPRIIELGAVKVNTNLESLGEFEALVNPEEFNEFTIDIENLTGISKGELENSATWKEVWPNFSKFTDGRSVVLCCWGWTDYPVVVSEYRRLGLNCPHSPICLDARSIVFTLTRVLNHNLKSWDLARVCSYYGIAKPKHRALGDARSVLSILRVIKDHSELDMGGIVAV